MKTTKMYEYINEEGQLVTSVDKPEVECKEKYHIVAEKGKVLTSDGSEALYSLIVEDASGYYEVDDPSPPDYGEEDLEEFESQEESDEVQSSE